MYVEPIDLGDELRQNSQSCLHLTPVVICRPIVGEFLHRCELHALRLITNGLLFGPLRGRNAPAKLVKLGLGCLEAKGTDAVGRTHLRNSLRWLAWTCAALRGQAHVNEA